MKAFKKVSDALGKKVNIPVIGSTPVGGIIAAGAYMLCSAITGYIQEQRVNKAIKTAVQDELLDLLKKMNEGK